MIIPETESIKLKCEDGGTVTFVPKDVETLLLFGTFCQTETLYNFDKAIQNMSISKAYNKQQLIYALQETKDKIESLTPHEYKEVYATAHFLEP